VRGAQGRKKMEKVVIKAVRREIIGKQVKKMRREGKLPAVMYGHHVDPIPLVLDQRETTRILNSVSLSQLLTMDLEGETYPVLVRDKQIDFIRGNLLHIDFLAVSMGEKISTSISVVIDGDAPAVKEFNGIVVSGANELEIECLPGDLPENIVVDVSNLMQIGDAVYVRDLDLGDKIEIMDDPDTMLAVITPFETIVEEEVEEEIEIEEPELVDQGKREEEEEE
jgi:large subunit ribosomal protein L25